MPLKTRTLSKPYLIETLPQLRALRSPARQEVLDAVQAAGPCSIAELGSLLGRAPDSLYYHVKSLLRLGLLTETPSGRPRPATLLDVPGRPMRIRYRPDPASRRALQAAVASMLRLTARDFTGGLQSPLATTEGPARNLWAARVKGRLTPAQTARLSALLHEASQLVVEASRSPHARNPLLAFTFCLTPIDRGRRNPARTPTVRISVRKPGRPTANPRKPRPDSKGGSR